MDCQPLQLISAMTNFSVSPYAAPSSIVRSAEVAFRSGWKGRLLLTSSREEYSSQSSFQRGGPTTEIDGSHLLFK